MAAIVESSEDAIIATSPDGTITSWNQGAERMYGYAAEEVVGGNVSVIVPEGPALAALRVLVIDDNRTQRETLRRQLRYRGAAASGAEAFAELRRAADAKEPYDF